MGAGWSAPGRSAPRPTQTRSFHPNTHSVSKYKLLRNKFLHRAHRSWHVTTVYDIQSLILAQSPSQLTCYYSLWHSEFNSNMIPTFSILLLLLSTVYTTCSQSNAIVQWIAGIEDTNTHVATSERPSLRMPLSRVVQLAWSIVCFL